MVVNQSLTVDRGALGDAGARRDPAHLKSAKLRDEIGIVVQDPLEKLRLARQSVRSPGNQLLNAAAFVLSRCRTAHAAPSITSLQASAYWAGRK